MAKKKAIKLATATAIAASAFAAAAPVQTSAAVNVDTVVKNAVKKMVAAQNSFVAKATDKKLVDVKTVQANQAAATKEYNAAKATVKKSGGKNTAALNAKLDAAKKTMDYRIKMYVDARKEVSALAVVNQATKKETDIAKLEGKVKELEAQLAKTEKLVAKVIGASTRDKMTALAVTPSKATLTKKKAELEAAQTPKVESVSAINLTKVEVKFSKAIDAAAAENFKIPGLTVSAATLSDDKKTVTLSVSGAELGKEYTVTATGLKANANVIADLTATFKAPTQNELYNPKVSFKDAVLKADGASSTLVTFELLDAQGNLLTNAQGVEVALTSTFGNFGEKRVTVQNGKATALLTSEALTSDKTAQITAQVVEAADKNLIGLKATNTILMTPNPGDAVITTGALMTEAEAFQADRVVVYFNKDVKVEDFTYTTGVNKGKIDPDKASIAVTEAVNNDLTGGSPVGVLGLMPVAGNSKALQVILDNSGNFPLTDNANVKVDFTDKRGNVAVPSTKAFKLTDARKPAMLNVTREGLKTIKVEFSEAVDTQTAQTLTNYTVDGKLLNDAAYGLTKPATATVGVFNPATGEDNRHVVTITLGTDANGNQIYFKSGKHSVQGANIGDWASKSDSNNFMNTQTLDFDIPVDNAAPTATVEVQSPEQYLVSFDKDLNENAAALEGGKMKMQKYNKDTAKWEEYTGNPFKVIQLKDANNNDTSKYLVEVTKDWTDVYDTRNTNKNYYNDSYRLVVEKDQVTSAANGIKNAEIVLTLGGAMTTPDVTSPVISKIEKTVDKAEGTSYDVTMSEPVKMVGTNEGDTLAQGQSSLPTPTAQFIKKDGSVTVEGVVAPSFADGEDKVLRVTPKTQLEGGDWTLVVRSISDDVGNTAPSATKDFTVVKETTKSDFKVVWSTVDADGTYDPAGAGTNDTNADYVFVKFSKPVSLTGAYKNALSTANYTINGKALPDGTQILADIKGYDNKDKIVDSITIKLPDGYVKSTDAVINVSKFLESDAGEVITNGGEFKLPYNFGTAGVNVDKTVANLDELKKALASDAVRSIKLTAPINLAGETLQINRAVDLDLNGQTVTGNINVNVSEGATMGISATTAGTITGNLVVNAPNADFVVGANVTVGGTTTIKDVASSTFVNNGTLTGKVTIEDPNGTGFKNTGTLSNGLEIATTGSVKLDGTINSVVVTKAAKVEVVTGATVTTLTSKATGVTLTGTGTVTNKIAEGGTLVDKDGKPVAGTIIVATAAELKVLTDAVTAATTKHTNAVEGTDAGQYATGSKATFKTAIDAADAVAKKANVTKAEIDKAVADLATATTTFDAAKVVPATAAELKVLTDAVTAATTKHDAAKEGSATGEYTVGSKATFKTAIDAADAVAKKANVTKAEIDKAVADLATATTAFDAAIVK